MEISRHGGALAPIPVLVLLIASVLQGCDGAGTKRTCNVLDVSNHINSASFLDNNQMAVAQFQLEQKITTYETGDCEKPSSNTDGVRLVIRNLTACTLDIDFSISVFQGSVGWTIERSTSIGPGATSDQGVVSTADAPVVDQVQIVLAGKAVTSNCS
jgi:hypothetical protein